MTNVAHGTKNGKLKSKIGLLRINKTLEAQLSQNDRARNVVIVQILEIVSKSGVLHTWLIYVPTGKVELRDCFRFAKLMEFFRKVLDV